MYYRRYDDWILLSTLPHFWTAYRSLDIDIVYSSILTTTTFASLLWHESHEASFTYLCIDYLMTAMLVTYEIGMSNDKLWVAQLNMIVFIINKVIDALSRYDIVKYDIGHGFFHLVSAVKVYYVAEVCLRP
jgi:hypothetical protein